MIDGVPNQSRREVRVTNTHDSPGTETLFGDAAFRESFAARGNLRVETDQTQPRSHVRSLLASWKRLPLRKRECRLLACACSAGIWVQEKARTAQPPGQSRIWRKWAITEK